MSEMGYSLSDVILLPLQLTVGIYLMYSFIGVSFLAGMGIIFLLGLQTFIIGKVSAKANDKLLTAKDKRMKIATEIFNIIRFIKVNAW
jgi:ABC-type bacteriocin/lantibiotic exporter with double-glycine peptidase domain